MAVKKYNPYTPSRRFITSSDFAEITKGKKPEKSLLIPFNKTGGHNNQGRTTMWTRAGGHKRRLRIVDFRRMDKAGIPAKIAAIEYDPNRSARLALLHYADGEKRYIIAPSGVSVGQTVVAGEDADIRDGNTLPLRKIPDGSIVHAVELKVGKGAQIGRSAGAEIQVMAREGDLVLLRLASTEMRYVPADCCATVGKVGNVEHNNQTVGKAGRSRWKGRRPGVRGTAMNPVDHPMGGGEGRGKGNHPMTPWGVPTKGYKTRDRKKQSSAMIVRRRSK